MQSEAIDCTMPHSPNSSDVQPTNNPSPSRSEMFSKRLQNLLPIGLSSEPSPLFSGHRLLSVVNKEWPAVPLFSFCPDSQHPRRRPREGDGSGIAAAPGGPAHCKALPPAVRQLNHRTVRFFSHRTALSTPLNSRALPRGNAEVGRNYQILHSF